MDVHTHICTSENLIEEHFDMIFRKLLGRDNNLMQIGFHEIADHKAVYKSGN